MAKDPQLANKVARSPLFVMALVVVLRSEVDEAKVWTGEEMPDDDEGRAPRRGTRARGHFASSRR